MTSPTPKPLSLFDATMLVMGGIIGIGIFLSPATIAREVPNQGAYLLVWGLGAVAALAGAMTFAELSASFPRTGGWYVWIREAFGGLPAFLFAWVVLLVVSTGACALVADFMGAQVAELFGGGRTVKIATAASTVILITGLGLAGLKSSAIFQNLCMLLKLGAVGTFIVCGLALFSGDPAAAVEVVANATPVPKDRSLAASLAAASLGVLFTFGGWQLLSYIAPSVENPQRNLPRAIVFGVSAVAVLYFLVNLSYLRVLGFDGLAANLEAPMAQRMAEATLGAGVGETFVTSAMAVSALGFLVATLITTPGIYVAMAEDGLFLKRFGALSERTGAPVWALLTQLLLVLAYFVWSTFDAESIDLLTGAVVFAEWIFHFLAALALLVLVRRGGSERPFVSPLYPLFPVLYALLAVGVVLGNLIATTSEKPGVTMLGVVVLAAGALAYWPWSKLARR